MKDNISSEITHYKDIFLDFENDYLKKLLENKIFQEVLLELSIYPSEKLFQIAKNLIEEVENSLVSNKDMEQVEFILLALFTAIENYSKIKVKTL